MTGASSGIGREIARILAAQGCNLVLCARRRAELEALATELADKHGIQSEVVVSNLASVGGVKALIATAGEVDIVVNNAGFGFAGSTIERDTDGQLSMIDLNVRALTHLSRHYGKKMAGTGRGRILNVASIAGKVPAFHGAAYSTSKHAVIGLTKVTAAEVAAHGVTANAICPGVTRSLMNDKRIEYDAERLGVTFEHLEQTATPLGRRLEPEEIATLAVYLASDGAAAVNGQSINVCGGTVVV